MLQSACDKMRSTRMAAGCGLRAAGNVTPKKAIAGTAAPPPASLAYADLIAMVALIERANAFSEFRLNVAARRSACAGSNAGPWAMRAQ